MKWFTSSSESVRMTNEHEDSFSILGTAICPQGFLNTNHIPWPSSTGAKRSCINMTPLQSLWPLKGPWPFLSHSLVTRLEVMSEVGTWRPFPFRRHWEHSGVQCLAQERSAPPTARVWERANQRLTLLRPCDVVERDILGTQQMV